MFSHPRYPNSPRTPHLRIADTAGTYTLRNADSSACRAAQPRCGQHRYLHADTATPHCRHRRHLHTPQPGLVGRQGWHGLIADAEPRTVTADTTVFGTSHYALRTTRPMGRGPTLLWTLQLCIAGTATLHCGVLDCPGLRTFEVRNTANLNDCGLHQSALRTRQVPTQSAMRTWFTVGKELLPHCGLRGSTLQTTQVPTHSALWTCRRGGGFRTTPVTHCGHRHSVLRTTQVPTHSTMQTRRQVGEAWTHCGHPADERARRHCGLCVSALQTMQAPSYSAMQVCCGCAVSMLLALRECVAT